MPVILNVTHSNIYKNQIVKCKNVIRILLEIKIFILSKSRRRLINNAEKFTHTHTSNIHALDNTTSQYSEIVLSRSSLTKIIYYERVETKLERSDMKEKYLAKVRSINATIAVTIKTPKVAVLGVLLLEVPSPLSAKDTDFFEREVLRLFYINMSRVVRFDFAAYPEDRSKEDNSFVPLHYHAAIRSENDAKFLAVAPRKYAAVLESVYSKQFANILRVIAESW